MSEAMLIQQCSPTLAGIKTANLFSMHYLTVPISFPECIRDAIRRQ